MNTTHVANLFGKANKKASEVLEREDILLLFVTIVDITGTTAQVDKRLVVVRCGGVLRVLIEAKLTFIQHAVQVHPRSAVMWERKHKIWPSGPIRYHVPTSYSPAESGMTSPYD